MTSVHIVWFKRDLRIADHRPLVRATEAAEADDGVVIPLYITEPGWWAQPDMAHRHWDFIRECLSELDTALGRTGAGLVARTGEAVEVLEHLRQRHGVTHLWSHQETGTAWTYDRDKAVSRWARERGIIWQELPQHGVIRALKDRDGWARRWDRFMAEPISEEPSRIPMPIDIDPGSCPGSPPVRTTTSPEPNCPDRQRGGRTAALWMLDGFLHERGEGYRTEMSSPLSAETACSRISPHLAWGTLSMREAAQATWSRMREVRDLPREERGHWGPALRSFVGRLHWHCHFIQKFEDQPEIEIRALHPAYEGIRPFDPARHDAWAEGRTGLPFVDACMRSLAATGWINFRMRAMLMAVSSYHLWNHWREPGLHLARLFTDYEPGIHWAQTQMQSGTTGINTPRIYNPIKQGRDQDPDGVFIRRWVPELAALPKSALHEPWTLSPLEQKDLGFELDRDYPAPIVDHLAAAREARSRVWGVRKGDRYRMEADAIQTRHGSRKSGIASPQAGKTQTGKTQTGKAQTGRKRRAGRAAEPSVDQGRLEL
jgi:deoxyribodipyrimidine photo-lyase